MMAQLIHVDFSLSLNSLKKDLPRDVVTLCPANCRFLEFDKFTNGSHFGSEFCTFLLSSNLMTVGYIGLDINSCAFHILSKQVQK